MICKMCGQPIFWSFANDRYLHSYTRGAGCNPGITASQAAPLVRGRGRS